MSFRSFLFTPATLLNRLGKAFESDADWAIIDLEDGVAPADKSVFRQKVDALAQQEFNGFGHRQGLRVNGLSTTEGVRDIHMMLDWRHWPDLIVLPKVESAKEVTQLQSIALSCGQNPTIMVTLETAQGVEAAAEILRGVTGPIVVGYGSVDHSAQTGSSLTPAALAWARGKIVNACAIAQVPAIDGVHLSYGDMESLSTEAALVRDMGFAGKIAIHPDQIKTINTVFTPTRQDIETAKAMIIAAEQAGGGAFAFQGKMVDAPVLAQAHRKIKNVRKEK